MISAWRPAGLVARREITTRLVSKAFRISTLVLLGLLVGLAVVLPFIGGSSAHPVGFTSQNASLAAPFAVVATASGAPTPELDAQRITLGIVTGVLIYVSLQAWGQFVAQGVVEEKSSRVVELLLSTIRPWQLMAGKVAGIGLVGLVQIVIVAAGGAIAGLATGALTISASAAAATVVWLVVWYLLGFFSYALVLAAASALVSRQEEIAGVVTPILMLLFVPYVLGLSILPTQPDSSLIEVVSLIPLFAPTLMPMRLAFGGVPVWQAGLAVALVVLLIPALVWLSGRIYRNAVLRTGARVRLRDALRDG